VEVLQKNVEVHWVKLMMGFEVRRAIFLTDVKDCANVEDKLKCRYDYYRLFRIPRKADTQQIRAAR
jgi:hypothetical protein